MMDDIWKTPVTLAGKVVRLEPLTMAHIPALAAVGCDDRIWRLMLYGMIRTEEDMRVWVQELLRRQAAGTDLPFVVIHLESGMVVGATRYMDIRPKHKGLEIGGTWYGLEFQRGFAETIYLAGWDLSRLGLLQHPGPGMAGCENPPGRVTRTINDPY